MALERSGERRIGRYALYGEIASGGMATVHFGRLIGPAGFSRTVAIKRLHPQLAKDPEFVAMFLDEARLAARLKHPNVVPILDVIAAEDEVLLVMEYVHGESLVRVLRGLQKRSERPPLRIASSLICGVLHGLHAAHEAVDEGGASLGIVHRDVSPQNVMVSAEGNARLLDFGVAKAMGRVHVTRDGQIKGKLAYMAPEQLRKGPIDRRVDIFAAAVVLWETITVRRLFEGDSEMAILAQVTMGDIPPPSSAGVDVPPSLEAMLMRGLARDPDRRFRTARDMAMALEAAVPPASPWEVGEWLAEVAGDALARRAHQVQAIERAAATGESPLDLTSPGGAIEAASSPSAMRSQVSGIALPPPPAGRGLARSGLILAAAGVVGGAVAAFVMLGKSEAPAPAPETHAPAAAPTAPAVPPEPASPPSAAPVTAPPTATASATAPPAITTVPKPSAHSPGKTAPTATPKSASGGCNPPYTIDSKGIRRIKPECL